MTLSEAEERAKQERLSVYLRNRAKLPFLAVCITPIGERIWSLVTSNIGDGRSLSSDEQERAMDEVEAWKIWR